MILLGRGFQFCVTLKSLRCAAALPLGPDACNVWYVIYIMNLTILQWERERERNITSCCSAMLSTDSRLWMAQLPSSAKLEAAPLPHTYNLLLHFSIAVMLSQIRRLGLKTETSRFFVSPPASAPRQIITWRRMAYECVVTGATGCVGYIKT